MRSLVALLIVAGSQVWSAEPLPIVTGNTIVQDITATIGGETVAATCLQQPGIDVHAYQPVPADVQRLAVAKVVVINGLGFEGWFEGLAKEAGLTATVVVASRGIAPLTMSSGGHDHGHHDHDHDGEGHDHSEKTVDDPHAFNAIANGVRYAENIRDALIAADPVGAAGYRARGEAYIAELRAADAWARREFAAIPRARRKLVTDHDALQYFAKEYGFTIVAPNTALEDSQPSAKDIAGIVAFIRAQGVKAVFLEAGKSGKVIEQIAAEAGVRVGDRLHLDCVGPAGSPTATYLGMFRHNVTAILEGLR